MNKKKQQYTASSSSTNLTEQNRNKIKQVNQRIQSKKELQIEAMSNEQLVVELKEKKLPTFGTVVERKERLKKHYGLMGSPQGGGMNDSTLKDGTNNLIQNPPLVSKKSSCLDEIERLKQNREERRKKMDDLRKLKTERELQNEANGIKVDVDFQVMVEESMRQVAPPQNHIPADQLKICVCVKKRPIFSQELQNGEIDCVSALNPTITVHECRYKVDGITKYVENSEFQFDNAFSHSESNDELYNFSMRPIMDLAFNQGIVTVFAYGQTGSGKTFTMQGLQELAIKDLFERGVNYFQEHKRNFTVTISMYEIYGGKIYDLLNNHEMLKLLEDKNQKVVIQGLKEQFVQSEEEILSLITFGNSVRTTHATKANDTSSRSHAVCQIKIHEEGCKNSGKLLLVDLAGSERAQDCQSNNKERQQEGAEINKSLLALKECVRALDSQKIQASQGQHVPFRSSKLTMVLRDSFMQSEKVKILMLACICPGSSSTDHTLNTLRYADRLKDNTGSSSYQLQTAMTQPAHSQHISERNMNQAAQQIDEQLRLFKKQNSHKYITNDQQQENTGATKKSHTSLQQQKKDITRDSHPIKNGVSKDVFYNHHEQQEFNSFSDLDEDAEMGEDDDMMMMDEPTQFSQAAQAHQHPIQQLKSIQKHDSPQSKAIAKPAQAQVKHNFQQKSTAMTAPSATIKQPVQSKIAPQIKQHKIQSQAQQNLLHLKQGRKQDDSFGSDEDGTGKSSSPSQPNKSKMFQGGQVITRKSQDPMQMKVQTPPKQTPYVDYQAERLMQQDDEDMMDCDDDRIAAEEIILNGHLECVKEEAQLITQEGELITKIEKAMVNETNYDMKGYLDMAEVIARKKLEMYSSLLNQIGAFKRKFADEL